MRRTKRTAERRFGARAASAAAVFLAALPAGPAGAQGPPGGQPPTPVRAEPVVVAEVQEQRQITGDLRARARSNVATLEDGQVIAFPVEEGDAVNKGDMLARLDDRRLRLDLQRIEAEELVAQATVAERAAQVRRTQRDYDLLKELSEQRAGNPKELADAEADLQVAQARHEQAKRNVDVLHAQAELLRTRLEDTVITAPFDGVIVAKHTEVGQWVGAGDPLVELVSVGTFEAWLAVPQDYAEAVTKENVEVGVQVRASRRSYPPTRPRIIRQVDPVARTFYLVVRIEDEDDALAPGMSVTGRVPTGERGRHVLVPRDALMRNEAGFFVYMVSRPPASPGGSAAPPAQAAPRQVSVLFEHDEAVAVRPGPLKEGDLVVVEGNERLRPMMAITVIDTTGTETARAPGGAAPPEPRGEASRSEREGG
ncbi:MAG: efflux RND transporter periplasmic adaptor subunit [Planctomycetota bacterium]|nr:efflux RND transporter periplasmic adaptor subunit [Planctomycetota bacterium]